MNIKKAFIHLFSVFCFSVASVSAVLAEETFEETTGKFMIDLPAGYALSQNMQNILFKFEGKGPLILVLLDTDKKDKSQAYQTAMEMIAEQFNSHGYKQPVKEGTVNGRPAKWAELSQKKEVQGKQITIYALVGGVGLKQAGLSFFSIYSLGGEQGKWVSKIHKSFASIREVGEPVTGLK